MDADKAQVISEREVLSNMAYNFIAGDFPIIESRTGDLSCYYCNEYFTSTDEAKTLENHLSDCVWRKIREFKKKGKENG